MDLRMDEVKVLARRNKGAVAAIAVATVMLVIGFAIMGRYRAAGRALSATKAQIKEFGVLSGEYLEKKAAIDMAARRARSSAGGETSAITEIERIGERAGAKSLITSIKPLEERQTGGYTEKELEVSIERIDLNRLVNLLYLIENNKRLLVVREFSMKSRFEDPNLLDIRLKIAQLTRSQ